MSKTLGCVLVPPSSNRLSRNIGPVASRRLAGRPVIDWVVRRFSEAQQIDELVVVLYGTVDSEVVRSIPRGVEAISCRSSTEYDSLYEVATTRPSESMVCVGVSSPFVDPTLIDRLITSAMVSSADYASFGSIGNKSVIHSRLGLVADWYRTSAIVDAHKSRQGDPTTVPSSFAQFFLSRPEEYSLKLLSLPREIDCSDLCLTLESADDWAQAEQIVEALGEDRLDWKEIATLLDRQSVYG